MESSEVKTPFFTQAGASSSGGAGGAAALNIDDLFGDCFFTPNGETGTLMFLWGVVVGGVDARDFKEEVVVSSRISSYIRSVLLRYSSSLHSMAFVDNARFRKMSIPTSPPRHHVSAAGPR